jgi:hypothetical protein
VPAFTTGWASRSLQSTTAGCTIVAFRLVELDDLFGIQQIQRHLDHADRAFDDLRRAG